MNIFENIIDILEDVKIFLKGIFCILIGGLIATFVCCHPPILDIFKQIFKILLSISIVISTLLLIRSWIKFNKKEKIQNE